MPDDRLNAESYAGVRYARRLAVGGLAGGMTATAHVRAGQPSDPGGVALAVGTAAPGGLTLDLVAGEVVWAVPAARTASLAPGDYWYEVLLYDAGGECVGRPAWGFWQHLPTGLVSVAPPVPPAASVGDYWPARAGGSEWVAGWNAGGTPSLSDADDFAYHDELLAEQAARQAGDAANAAALAGKAAVGHTHDAGTLTGTLDAARLPASGVTAGTYGSATQLPQITFDAAGRATAITLVTVGGAAPDLSAYATKAGPVTHTGTHTFDSPLKVRPQGAGVTAAEAIGEWLTRDGLPALRLRVDDRPGYSDRVVLEFLHPVEGSVRATLALVHGTNGLKISGTLYLDTLLDARAGIAVGGNAASYFSGPLISYDGSDLRLQPAAGRAVDCSAPVRPAGYAVALLPSAVTYAGGVTRVTDRTPPNRLAYSDGTSWRWVGLDTLVT